jgi:dUTP pyrophosphatase
MYVLHDKDINAMQQGPKQLISNFISWEHQLQPNGFDLTAHDIYRFKGAGKLDFSNKERQLPECEEIEWNDMWAHLGVGAYKVKTNEMVALPKDIIAFAQTRSSLLRMGCHTANGFWDAGFEGKSEFLLIVNNPFGLDIKRNARVAQIVFIRLNSDAEKEYTGQYKHLD